MKKEKTQNKWKIALLEASNWDKYATEHEYTNIPINKAKKNVLKRIFEKYSKD